MLITSSKDTSAKVEKVYKLFSLTYLLFSMKLYDSSTLDVLKTYKTERPVNSAAISPLLDHVSLCFNIILARCEAQPVICMTHCKIKVSMIL